MIYLNTDFVFVKNFCDNGDCSFYLFFCVCCHQALTEHTAFGIILDLVAGSLRRRNALSAISWCRYHGLTANFADTTSPLSTKYTKRSFRKLSTKSKRRKLLSRWLRGRNSPAGRTTGSFAMFARRIQTI